MDELKELLARLNDPGDNPLNDEELTDLRAKLQERAAEIGEEDSDEALAELRSIAEAVTQVDAESQQRAEAAEARATEREELLGRIAPAAETTPGEGEGEGEGEGDGNGDGAEGEGEGEGDPTPAEGEGAEGTPAEGGTEGEGDQPTAQAASAGRPSPGAIGSTRPRRQRARERETDSGLTVITAAGDVPGVSAGAEFGSPEQAGEAFAKKTMSLMGTKGGKYPVMSVHAPYPEERVLTADASRNLQLIENVISPQALVAAGGNCAPIDASYDFYTPQVTDRPVRDALARFQADRGGVKTLTPPSLTQTNPGVAIWTNANDIAPAAPATKPCVVVTCGAEVEVLVDAITLCLQVGNFNRRFFPEQFRAWYQVALAAHARVAEGNLLDRISTLSTAITEARTLGAARDLLEGHGRLAAQYRSRHRVGRSIRLTVLMPAWALDLIREDIARQLPGDNTLAVADAEIERFFTARNLDVVWYLDGEPGEGQVAANQAAGAGNDWGEPDAFTANIVSYMFVPGTFLFVDGGTLDLGIDIRDSTLNSTNDVKSFMETFENVAFTGVESLKITSNVCVSGASAAALAVACSV